MIIHTNRGLLLGAKVDLIRPDRVTAEWTHRSLTPNDQFLYIAAKYVEADKPNENKHFWSFEDLQKSQATIVNSPINVMHEPHNIVGVMVDQEMMYPEAYKTSEAVAAKDYSAEKRQEMAKKGQALPDGSFPIADKGDLADAIASVGRAGNSARAKAHIIKRARQLGATDMLPDAWKAMAGEGEPVGVDAAVAQVVEELLAAEALGRFEPVVAYEYAQPYIEVLGALWKFYFPQTVSAIEAAQEMGSLFISMECIADTVTRVDRDGTEHNFPFRGGSVKDYEFHGESDYVRLNDPHFVGCGLVLPPGKPGWKGAEVRELIGALDDSGEALYEQVKAQTPHLSPDEWEQLMLTFLASSAR